MVHQDDFLPTGTDEVIPGKRSDHPVFVIQNRIGPEAALNHDFTNVIQVIIQMEKMQIG